MWYNIPMSVKFDVYPTQCNLCGGVVEYKRMESIGIRPYQSGYCYICTSCNAYVGTHRKKPKEALGLLADSATRHLRVICHDEFDKHWYTLAGRNRAYYRLSLDLGIKPEDCHFAHMDEDTLLRALDFMQDWGNFK